ncbi:type VI secretion system tube protein TssD [Hymenobacter cellulosilyticus]|uniref:YwqJ-like deaminase n=1 Tax=Hymenobacter cellulosilyticus TaxID=2932248 RepID=A0A8T9Q8E5_9BACT|nr:type VI secretion system tube protein TssD [Hymenobacter cellulosilyticus]UOQ72681.1 hypothetical protein MUN79_01410 [Hymenobacter cellulosilyticus]
MPILDAEIQVAGVRAPFAAGSFSFSQLTDYQGRPSTDVQLGLIKLTLVGEAASWSIWEEWMLDSYRRQSGRLVFYHEEGQTAKTVVFYDAFCVHYEGRFDARGQNGKGSFRTILHLSAAAEEVQGQFTEAHSTIPWATDEATRKRALTKPASLRPTPGLKASAVQPLPSAPATAPVAAQSAQPPATAKKIGLQQSLEEIRAQYGEAGVRVVEHTEAEALRVLSTQSNAERGPVLSGIIDPTTGNIFFGQNTDTPPPNLHSLLGKRLEAYLKATNGKTPENLGVAGAHSEIYALDQALKAREKHTGRPVTQQDLAGFLLHNRSLRGSTKGVGVPPRCTNCAILTDGLTVIGNN